MNKLDHISRHLARAEKKKFEHYVVTRIWHLLNDTRIKIVTQQYVSRPEGKALTDMYFPQLEIHIEIDEGHHRKQIEEDKLREADIINATGHTILRVDVTKNIEEVNNEIDERVAFIKNKIISLENFKPWDLEAEQNPQTYIERGYIDLKDDVAFRTMADAASCFGRDYSKGLQRSYIPHPTEPNKYLSFPKLYENDEWSNQLSENEDTITEYCKIPEKKREHIDRNILEVKRVHSRIVFARVKSPLGTLMYRFKGEYNINLEATNYENGLIWKRIATRVKTYPNIG